MHSKKKSKKFEWYETLGEAREVLKIIKELEPENHAARIRVL